MTRNYHEQIGFVFIYKLVDPLLRKVFYVGQTRNPHKRLKQHIGQARREYNQQNQRHRWINGVLACDFAPKLVVLGKYPCEDGDYWEAHWVHHLSLEGEPLMNDLKGMPLGYLFINTTVSPDRCQLERG